MTQAVIFFRKQGSGLGGNIQVVAEDLVNEGGFISINNLTDNQPQEGIVITLTGDLVLKNGAAIVPTAGGESNSADLAITAKNIFITNNSLIQSVSEFGKGDGGDVNILAEKPGNIK